MKNAFLKISGLGVAVVLAAMSSLSSAAEYYKWVDSKGTTHYTKTPPPATAKRKTKVETYGWQNSAPTPSNTSSSNEAPSDIVKVAEEARKAAEEPKPTHIPQVPASDIPK